MALIKVLNHIQQIMKLPLVVFLQLHSVVSGVEIAKAPLTVRANDSFKFAGQDDPVGYNGVSYEGFAPDESSSVLSGTLAYNRSATPHAGGAGNTYDLTPSGLVSANYSFNYQNGTFTIVPQNQLVVLLPTRIAHTEIQ